MIYENNGINWSDYMAPVFSEVEKEINEEKFFNSGSADWIHVELWKDCAYVFFHRGSYTMKLVKFSGDPLGDSETSKKAIKRVILDKLEKELNKSMEIDLPKPVSPQDIPEYTEEEIKYWKADKEEIEKLAQSVKNDPINPNHYKHLPNGLETIDIIQAWTEGLEGLEAVCTANTIKYISRWKYKNGLEDLKKAKWYLDKLITVEEPPVVTDEQNDFRTKKEKLDKRLGDMSIDEIAQQIKDLQAYYNNEILYHLECFPDGLICEGEFNDKSKHAVLLFDDTVSRMIDKIISFSVNLLYSNNKEEDDE